MLKNKNKGFSLVELIVAIAIMAVLVAVLAPSLLSYTERSRAQKDDSAMSEVVNAVQLALSDQDCYDEVVHYNAKNNASCYIDTNKEREHDANKIITKEAVGNSKAQYTFDDNARLLDETQYYAAGNIRGVTLTLTPNEQSIYVLKDAKINVFLGGNDEIESIPYIYNRIRQTVGDEIKLTSQTYRNSDYTIFIKIGSTGGSQSSAQDAIQVYGQFSGTNLAADQSGDYKKASLFGQTISTGFGGKLYGSDLKFDEGMTWADWVNSEYNTVGAKIYLDCVLIPDVGYVYQDGPNCRGELDCFADEVIRTDGDFVVEWTPRG